MLIGIDASRAFGLERTGTENYSYYLITQMLRLPSAKNHFFVLFTRPDAVLPEEFAGYSNVEVVKIKWRILWTQGGLALHTWRKYQNAYLDRLFIPAHTLPVFGRKDIQKIVTIHGLEYRYLREYNNFLQRWYLPLSTYYAARVAERLIAVSESTKRDLLAEVKIPEEKVEVILEGVTQREQKSNVLSQANKKKVYEKYGIKHDQYILFVGTIQPRKNLAGLIRAFSLISSKTKQHKLVIVGAVGWEASEVMMLPEQLKICERVIFTGRVDDLELQILYRGASLYVQPSLTEGFGLPVLEAMQSRIPVIVSDGGALPEIVRNAGLVVRLGDGFEQRLGEAILRLINDRELAKKLVAAALERAKELSWANAAKLTLELITRR